ncbi:TonB-dependent receptor [candidate division KSB1 bacterium]|nr:TonB-dependent receptor [candidate division KSB1 bacterium]
MCNTKRWMGRILLVILFGVRILSAQQTSRTGSLKGIILDADSKAPVIGANIVIVNTTYGAVSDLEGKYTITGLAVGAYGVRYSCIGYEAKIITDVIIKSARAYFLDVELQPKMVSMAEVIVHGGYFSQVKDQPVSAVNMSYEEIRRAPGSAGDVSRILYGLPGVAKVNDQTNNLIVRGGSPIENGFYIDNIEIPNINHFPTQGASGGPLSLINVDLIKEVNFYTGGFSSLYGDRLSAIMELKFREGDREQWNGQLDLNFAGFGGVAEGPLGQKGSWMLSARRSYLDLLVQTIDVGSTVAPRYGDYQGKIVYRLNRKNKVSLLMLWGDDHNHPDHKTAVQNDMQYYGRQDIFERTTGLNWQTLWGEKGFSDISLSHTSTQFHEDFKETNTQLPLLRNHSSEGSYKIRNVNTLHVSGDHSVEFGAEGKILQHTFDNRYGEVTNALGDALPGVTMQKSLKTQKWAGFINFIIKPVKSMNANLGLRYDYFGYHQKGHLSPRASFAWQVSQRTSVSMSAGLFYQTLPMILLAQNSSHRNLKDPMATHHIMGVSRLLTENTKLSVEAYVKRYRRLPMDPDQPELFLLDEIMYRYGFFFGHAALQSAGRAEAKGVEVILQKKLARRFYGLASAGIFRARYRDLQGTWRDRVFDNRYLFSIEGGYKPNANWEFSGRWIYAGGAPYTPFDLDKSAQAHREVLDQNRVNGARYPAYHSLNIRFDRRFHFYRSNLIFYLSVWNVYGRKNIATYFWNDPEQKQDVIYQWGTLPIFGLEYEF